jgi:hypothetical protein
MFLYWCIFLVIPSHWRERCLGRFGTWGWERRLVRGADVAHVFGRPWVSVRPERVCHCEMAGRGQASGAKSPCSGRKAAKSPEERTEAKKSPRRNVERRCRVPLFPGDPGNKPRLLPKVRLSAFRLPLFSSREVFSNPTTRKNSRAAMTLALFRRSGMRHRTGVYPEFGNIIVQVGNSRLGRAGPESILPVPTFGC